MILERFWRRFREFGAISWISKKSAIFKTMGYSPFAQNRPIFDFCEFTLNRQKESRKQSQIVLERFWRRFREFRTISRSSKNRPCSKPWAIAQAFFSKSANFRPLGIHPKSTQTVAEAFANHFRTVLEAFQRVSNDFQESQNRPCSKPWAIAQAFCSKSANFRHLRNHPKSTQTVVEAVKNHFRTVLEAFQRVSNDFQEFKKSAIFKTMGYSSGILLKIGQFSTGANSP